MAGVSQDLLDNDSGSQVEVGLHNLQQLVRLTLRRAEREDGDGERLRDADRVRQLPARQEQAMNKRTSRTSDKRKSKKRREETDAEGRTCTMHRRQRPAATSDLATHRAAYAADLSTLVGSLPEKAPPPCAPQPP